MLTCRCLTAHGGGDVGTRVDTSNPVRDWQCIEPINERTLILMALIVTCQALR